MPLKTPTLEYFDLKMVFSLFFYMLGIYLGNSLIKGILAPLLICLIILTIILILKQKRQSVCVWTFVLFLFFGILMINISYASFTKKAEANLLLDQKSRIQGIICEFPEISTKKTKITIKAQKIYFENNSKPINDKILLFIKNPTYDLKIYDTIFLNTKLLAPKKFKDFDYPLYLKRQGINLIGFIRSRDNILKIHTELSFWKLFIRKICEFRISFTKFLNNNDKSGIIKALTIGEKNNLSKELRQSLFFTGTSHLFVISGLHIGLISLYIFILLKFLFSFFPSIYLAVNVEKIISTLVIILLTLYLFLLDFPNSATRAYIVIVIFLLSKILEQKPSKLHIIFISAFLILLFKPSSLFNIGFQLSYLSVFAIVLIGTKILEIVKERSKQNKIIIENFTFIDRIKYTLYGYLIISVSVWLITLPLVSHYFKIIPIISPLYNIILIPIISLIMIPLILFFFFLFFMSPNLASLFLYPIKIIILLFEQILLKTFFFTKKIALSFQMPNPLILLYYLTIAFFVLLFYKRLIRVKQGIDDF